MTDLDQLPPEQRAVLSLLLRQRKGYEDVASLLRIEPDAVRARALAALTALGPPELSDLAPEIRQEVGDYLLGQQTASESEATRALFKSSGGARTWGAAVSEKVGDLAAEPLPEIPRGRPFTAVPPPTTEPPAPPAPPPGGLPPRPATLGPEPPKTPASPPAASGPPAAADRRPSASGPARAAAPTGRAPGAAAPPTRAAPQPPPPPEDADTESAERTSRRGGYLVLAAVAVIVAAVIVVVVDGGFSSGSSSDNGAITATRTTQATSHSTSTAAPRIEAQINFSPAVAGSHALAVANIIAQGTLKAFALSAQGLPPTTGFAYAVWLYNSQSDAKLLGFIPQQVTASGSTAGQAKAIAALPPDASRYREMVITRETAPKPSQPGPIVLVGQLGSVG